MHTIPSNENGQSAHLFGMSSRSIITATFDFLKQAPVRARPPVGNKARQPLHCKPAHPRNIYTAVHSPHKCALPTPFRHVHLLYLHCQRHFPLNFKQLCKQESQTFKPFCVFPGIFDTHTRYLQFFLRSIAKTLCLSMLPYVNLFRYILYRPMVSYLCIHPLSVQRSLCLQSDYWVPLQHPLYLSYHGSS